MHNFYHNIHANQNKITTADEAVKLIKTGDTVVLGGFVGTGSPDALYKALEKRFLETGQPRDLTYTFPAATGDGNSEGVNRIAHEGLVSRAIFGHIGLVPALQNLIVNEKITAYNLPLGVITHLYRDIAAGKPGTITHVGLCTFADPEFGGGKMNGISNENMVQRINLDGNTYLFYKRFPINIALIRGTTADREGNVSLEDEALNLSLRSIAAAVKNCGGKVIVQVKRLVENGVLTGRQIHIPECFVDAVVRATAPDDTRQTYLDYFNPTFCGDLRIINEDIPFLQLNERKIVARRALFELTPNAIVNLGIGMPESLAAVAAEEDISKLITLTTEAGVVGGVPCGGLNFGVSYNPEAFFAIADQFDFYDGGGLHAAFLGLAQVDADGNLNVSKFGSKIPGFGGFINISQNSKKIVFMGSFTAGGLKVAIEDGLLRIVKEGSAKKFVSRVEQCTFNGKYAAAQNKTVLYITERCVFKLTAEGLELTEIAPGIDPEKDIFAHMEFRPIVKQPKLMDKKIFLNEMMGITVEELIAHNK